MGHAYFDIDYYFPDSTRSCSSCIPLFVHDCKACIELEIKQKPVKFKFLHVVIKKLICFQSVQSFVKIS